jgi:hypothetical protein
MYYISINAEDANKLQYYCRNCNYVDDTISKDGGCILQTHIKHKTQPSTYMVNKYTKFDPTLPRIYNMDCPNADCTFKKTNDIDNPEIIYLRYDDANLKYLYICTVCDTTWHSNSGTNT